MRWPAVALLAGIVGTARSGYGAGSGEAWADSAAESNVGGAAAGSAAAAASKSSWRGSAALFDQSVSTQTVGLGADYQSADPTYEWWVALKPRYFAYEDRVQSVSLNGWANLYYELTSSDTTTRKNELVVGPTWLWAYYGRTLFERGELKTSMVVGPRLTLPTDKASRASGLLVGLGAAAGLTQALPISRGNAPLFRSARLGLNVIYSHPMSRATTPVDPGLDRIRQDAAGRTFLSDQLRGSMNVQHELRVVVSSGIQITQKLGLSLSYVFFNYWDHEPPETPICTATTGCIMPGRADDPTRYRVSTWAIGSIDYDVIDEMSIGFGYYNLTAQIGPDGQRRNPLWSPDARIFLTVTGNLDAIYDALAKGDDKRTEASSRGQPGPGEPKGASGF